MLLGSKMNPLGDHMLEQRRSNSFCGENDSGARSRAIMALLFNVDLQELPTVTKTDNAVQICHYLYEVLDLFYPVPGNFTKLLYV